MEQQQQLKKDTLYWVKFSELEDWTVAEIAGECPVESEQIQVTIV